MFESLWHLNKIHEKVTHHTFFGTWENLPFYDLLPTAANKALRDYEKGWEEFNLEIVRLARHTNTPCRAERLFQVVEKGDMTVPMVSLGSKIKSKSWTKCTVPSIFGRDPVHQHRRDIRSVRLRSDQHWKNAGLPEPTQNRTANAWDGPGGSGVVRSKRGYFLTQNLSGDSPKQSAHLYIKPSPSLFSSMFCW